MPATAMYTGVMAEPKNPAIFLRVDPQLKADLEQVAASKYLTLNPFLLALLRKTVADAKAGIDVLATRPA